MRILWTFQIEHIVAKQHRVDDGLDNLALACPDCNRHKGPNLTTLDRKTGDVIRLFNPRSDDWNEHFEVADGVIIGLTAIGAATVRLLDMNDSERVEMRTAISLAD